LQEGLSKILCLLNQKINKMLKMEKTKYRIPILTIEIIFLLLSLTCNSNSQSKPINNNMDTCEVAIHNILNREFTNWRGFPENCNFEMLTGKLTKDIDSLPIFRLGNKFNEVRKLKLNLEGYYAPSVYFYNGKLFLFEAMILALSESDSILINSLGEPEKILDWDFGLLPLPNSEFIFAKRGITLFLDSTHSKIHQIALYKPTTSEEYIAKIRPTYITIRRPRPRR
jgi:hypothetical protein